MQSQSNGESDGSVETEGKQKDTYSSASSSGGPFVLINNLVLFIGTIMGGISSIYADLFPETNLGQWRLTMAIGWIVGIVLVLWLLGFNDGNKTQLKFGGRVAYGFKLVKLNPAYALLVMFMLMASIWCFYSRYNSNISPNGAGNIKALLAATERGEQAAIGAKVAAEKTESKVNIVNDKTDILLEKTSRIEAELTKPLTPKESLAKRGIAWEAKSFHDAMVNGDLKTLNEMLSAGWNPLSQSPPGYGDDGSSLGHFFGRTEANAATVETIKIINKYTDLTKPQIRLGGTRGLTATSAALASCNKSMIIALKNAGINIHIINKPIETTSTFGDKYMYDVVERVKDWKNLAGIGFYCTETDIDYILSLISPVDYR